MTENSQGANLGCEAKLFLTVDKLPYRYFILF